MAKKKDRAFFTCPRWNEVANASTAGAPDSAASYVNTEILATIVGGRPVARSTLRKALLVVRPTAGPFDIDAYIVDQRRVQAR